MIPERIIDKAVHAAGENWVLTFEWEHDKLHAQVHAALEAVAADIWDGGYRAGFSDGPFVCACEAWNDGECACGNYGNGETAQPNPYRATETA